ncbi:hypothetical protein HQQ94_03515 [Shewanella sp. VB17]|uniref:hypothetical protein n=1 Tax=Shewanella sp. VB17 TaxID=2739432 RepID=UPI001564E288|nr:hypothetical protein [Shewanella sp. VB17]NRD72324.1 hypothetical protein [Shewanella sp. VB17]
MIIWITTLSFMAQTVERQQLSFTFYAEPNTNVYLKWVELIYTDAFNRLNIDFSYTIMPSIRASRMSDLGKVDGEIARDANYGTKHPNLVRINESIASGSLSAFAYNPLVNIRSWNDIYNSQYKVEYYRGSFLAHQRLSKHISPDRLSTSSTPEQSLRKLIRARIDIYVGPTKITNQQAATAEFANEHLQRLTTLEEHIHYGYLHQRHSELAITLAEVFRQMKAEGTFDAYFSQAQTLIDSQTTTP